MSGFYLAVMAGTILAIIIYAYCYALYRERYMGIWIIGWSAFFGRILLFDYGIFDWRQSLPGFTAYQLMYTGSALLFLWGTCVFANKPLNRYWFYGAAGTVFLSSIFAVFNLPLIYKILLPAEYGGVVLIYMGRVFTHHLKIKGIGNYITGYAFIVWGILTVIMPYTVGIPWLSPWCYLAAGVVRLIIAIGILLVYFDKTRSDLAMKATQYRLLAENAVDVIYRYSLLPVAKFEYISPSVTLVTGHTPEEYYDDPALLVKLIYPDDAPLYDSFVKNPAASDDLPLTFRLIRKDRKVIWLEQKTFPVSDMAGNITAVEGILRDVTARKNLEQIVSRSEKMNLVGQMAVSVAHEIRNPLTSVRGYLQLLSMKEENKTIKDRYNLMIEELDRTNLIVSEYLLLAKEKVPNLQTCCLNDIINALLPLMQAAAKDVKVEIKLALADTPCLYLDENEIRQLLFNLVNNGLDAMAAGGELVIGTSNVRDKVILSISDQGCGIPPHIRENLGTPFLTTKDTGTGLGLTVCYRIVNRHKAAMRVETGEQGTTFFVEFDVIQSAA